jgi:PAS domain S-box-containing protein
MTEPSSITRALLATIMHSTEPMVVTDPRLPDHPMIALNPPFEALTGYAAAEIVGRNCRLLQGEGTDPETPRRIGRCIAERRGCIEWIVNYRRDGSKFWNLLFISPVFAPDGTLLHFFGNQRNITYGPPADPPEFSLGQVDMPLQGQTEFHALLLGILDEPREEEQDEAARARALERIVEAARRLNEVTTRLTPAPWTPPAPTSR